MVRVESAAQSCLVKKWTRFVGGEGFTRGVGDRRFLSRGFAQQFVNFSAKDRRRSKAEDERGRVVRVDQALIDVALDHERFVLLIRLHVTQRIEGDGVEDLRWPDQGQKADVRGQEHRRHTTCSTFRTRLQAFVVDRV